MLTTVIKSLVNQGANETTRRSFEQIRNKLRPSDALWIRHFYFGKDKISFSYRSGSEGDIGVIDQIFVQEDYEVEHKIHGKALRSVYEKNSMHRTPLILDIGANIGASTVFFAKKYPKAHVYAIEPEPNNYNLLKLNTNGLNVKTFEGAIGCEDGTMYLEDPGSGDWGFRVVKDGILPVTVISVPSILKQLQAKNIFPLICKIDIEGGEADLFSKNTDWINEFCLIVIELHDWMLPLQRTSRNFIKAISNLDFEVFHHGENIFCFNLEKMSGEFKNS